MYAGLHKLGEHFQLRGEVSIYVLVAADGKVQWAGTGGVDEPEAKRLVALQAAQIQYKPARCGGKPCQVMTQFRGSLASETAEDAHHRRYTIARIFLTKGRFPCKSNTPSPSCGRSSSS